MKESCLVRETLFYFILIILLDQNFDNDQTLIFYNQFKLWKTMIIIILNNNSICIYVCKYDKNLD